MADAFAANTHETAAVAADFRQAVAAGGGSGIAVGLADQLSGWAASISGKSRLTADSFVLEVGKFYDLDVLANDSALAGRLVPGSLAIRDAGALSDSLTVADGKLRLKPTPGMSGRHVVSYSVFDDSSYLRNSQSVSLNVVNLTNAPTDILLSATTVAENQAAGSAVGTLSTTDPDAGNTFTYTLVSGTGSTDNGSFTIEGNVLKTAASFDFEAKSSYSIRVRSTDQGSLSTEKVLTISVTDVNETPTDITPSATTIAENLASGTAVGTLSTTDPDASNTFTYTLVSGTGSTDNGSFTIEGNVLKTAASFDFEAKSSYSIRVRSADQGGLATEKTFTFTVTDVVEVPGVPTDVVGTAGNGQVSLSWTSPTFNGGAAITDYAVEYSSNGGSTWEHFNDGVSAATTALVTSLANGTSYLFRVAAVNAVGTGGFSTNSAAVAPKAVPGAPTGLTGIAGIGRVTLSWTAPVIRGSSAITDYRVQYSSNGGDSWTTFSEAVSASKTATVTGLANGTSYLFRVAAVNAAGTGLSSVASAAVTPRTMPAAPTSVNAVVGSQSATVTWTAPTANGGAVVTDYRVQYSSNNGVTWTAFTGATTAARTATVTGLTNGTSYVFRVAAVNVAGVGGYTAKSAAATPRTWPGAPTNLSATPAAGRVNLAWQAPASNGGAAIKDYIVQYSSNNGVTWRVFKESVSSTTSASVTGLTRGTSYVFRVGGMNAAGSGEYSEKSSAVVVR